MMGTEIFKIDASWAEKLTKTRVSFLMNPTVFDVITHRCACEKSYIPIIMTSITWTGHRCVQEPAAILAPQNRTQGRCAMFFLLILAANIIVIVRTRRNLWLVLAVYSINTPNIGLKLENAN